MYTRSKIANRSMQFPINQILSNLLKRARNYTCVGKSFAIEAVRTCGVNYGTITEGKEGERERDTHTLITGRNDFGRIAGDPFERVNLYASALLSIPRL